MVTIILFAPLVGAILCGFGYKWLAEHGAIVTATRSSSSPACSAGSSSSASTG